MQRWFMMRKSASILPYVTSTTKMHILTGHILGNVIVFLGGTMLQAGRLQVGFPMGVIGFFNWPKPFSHIMALGSTQLLTEMNTRNLPQGK
jgi:hypothetical protein